MIHPVKGLLAVLLAVLLCGCACAGGGQPSPSPSASPANTRVASQGPSPTASSAPPQLPGSLEVDQSGTPLVKVYVVDNQAIEKMPIEQYLQGVLAGEMKNDWPMEALKAQAIIARTFALKFIEDKGGSKYEGADVSTDVEEAQAYDASGVNERIVQAIEETRGEVILSDGEFIYAWFHAHAGGVTALAKEGLGWEKEEPPYIQSVQVKESDKAPEDARHWSADFSFDEINAAIQAQGGGDASAFAIEETGPSGRVTSFTAGQGPIAAPSLRLKLGGTRMRSTLLTDLTVGDGVVHMEGSGYGHGVGMSQWGAYAMAEEGKTAEDIIRFFFKNVELTRLWPKDAAGPAA